jgi:hypothetical protein
VRKPHGKKSSSSMKFGAKITGTPCRHAYYKGNVNCPSIFEGVMVLGLKNFSIKITSLCTSSYIQKDFDENLFEDRYNMQMCFYKGNAVHLFLKELWPLCKIFCLHNSS